MLEMLLELAIFTAPPRWVLLVLGVGLVASGFYPESWWLSIVLWGIAIWCLIGFWVSSFDR